jgi:phosphatidylserine/phosphatidylglycerophosphate/cardiolipin synthase-like enzyme
MLKKKPTLLLLLILLSFFLLSIISTKSYATDLTLNNTPTQVYFSPKGGCTEAIISQIDKAKTEILVQAYSFTSAPIAKALLNTHKRGVKVEAILDKSQRREKYTSATFLANSGIPTFIDDRHAIAHNKIMIIDREIVITGSFNFTKAAEEKNAENLLIIRNKALAKSYMDNWYKHREHSEKYEGR